jgi:histidinol-phosphate phosphatase family protein
MATTKNWWKKINQDWTLFLDRDGVLNHDVINDYVRNWNQFHFFDTTLPAMKILAEKFSRIIIITNQRGVGIELMSQKDLDNIHLNMIAEIESVQGRIDKIYFCTDTDRLNSTHRKPAIGMGLQAKEDFPEIDFSKSIMVGNNTSDMQFGRKLNMHTVFIDDKKNYNKNPTPEMDLLFDNLFEFAKFLN